MLLDLSPAVVQGGADSGKGGNETHQRPGSPAGNLRRTFVHGECPRSRTSQQPLESASGRVYCPLCVTVNNNLLYTLYTIAKSEQSPHVPS